MTYHLRLKNAMSYTGVVNATREEPDVFTADEAIKAAALRSGYFDLVDVLAEQDTAAPADADTIPLTVVSLTWALTGAACVWVGAIGRRRNLRRAL